MFKKWGIIQIRTLAKNGGIVNIGGKCSENNINSKSGILQKMWGICKWGFRLLEWGILNAHYNFTQKIRNNFYFPQFLGYVILL